MLNKRDAWWDVIPGHSLFSGFGAEFCDIVSANWTAGEIVQAEDIAFGLLN